jgi:predicted N-acetyltransferase YhbS
MVRWATPADVPSYITLTTLAFRASATAEPNLLSETYSSELTSDHHPLSHWRDLAIVVDAEDTVVAGAILMRQVMDFDGIRLHVGRPESVVSADYVRHRGFVRHLFQLLHARSDALGYHLLVIGGIPYFYRKFGYEYGIEAEAFAAVNFADVPPTQMSGVHIVRARVEDYPTVVRLYDADRLSGRYMITTPFDYSYFSFVLEQAQKVLVYIPHLIYHNDDVIGYVFLGGGTGDGQILVWGLGVTTQRALQTYTVPIIHAINDIQHTIYNRKPEKHPTLTGIKFMLDEQHPLREQLSHSGIRHVKEPTGTWYTRVSDYAYMIESLRPVLERRLAHSSMCGFSGEVHLSFYGKGVQMTWQNGQLIACKNTRPPIMGEGTNGTYPPGAFMLQLFGRKSFRQIKYWHHEVWADAPTEQLLGILFPTKPSWFLHMN